MCTTFLVAHVPLFENDTYNVTVRIMNGGDLVFNHTMHLHFKIAYIDESFTKVHMTVRGFFILTSLIAALGYLCKICRVDRSLPRTYD